MLCCAIGLTNISGADACTGITLKSENGDTVVARTMDWARTKNDSMYVVMPRGEIQQSLLPGGAPNGMQFASKYGFVGLATNLPQFVVDGTNEAGLSAALFYFPTYGKYKPYDPNLRERSIVDLQLVSWILSNFSTIDELKAEMPNIRVINLDSRVATVHWRITEPNGKQVILEIVDGTPHFYDSKLGVLTNSPGYEWHMTNLNNFTNFRAGNAIPEKLHSITIQTFGDGSGLFGLPGDFTPPSRFVRAAFLSGYARPQKTAYDTVLQAFHLLNNFDVPLGVRFAMNETPPDMPSATQWTIATDLTHGIIYYHTMFDRTIRMIDMGKIDFTQIPFQAHKLADTESETIIEMHVNETKGNIPSYESIQEMADRMFK